MRLQCLDTSCNRDYNLSIIAGGDTLRIGMFPKGNAFDSLLVSIFDAGGVNRTGDLLFERGRKTAERLSPLPDGVYRLEVFVQYGPRAWTSYIYGNDILLESAGGGLRFMKPPHYGTNRSLLGGLRKDPTFLRECLRPSVRCESTRPDIRKLAQTLTRGVTGDYLKALAIHDWVAENIAYDYDSFYDGSYAHMGQSPGKVLASGKTVCQGFSDLFVSMLRAAGVPALSRACFALGQTTDGWWDRPSNRSAEANHDFSVFFADGRWILTDVTWDHSADINNGVRELRRDGFLSHKYFDISLPFLSETHRFCN